MITIIVWVWISVLAEFTKFLKRRFPNISTRVVVWLLSLLAWVVYYALEQSNPNIVEEAMKFATGAFATSQAVWMAMDKLLVKDLD